MEASAPIINCIVPVFNGERFLKEALARARAGGQARARGLRHRPPRLREGDAARRPARRSGDGPALHGHPLRRAGRKLIGGEASLRRRGDIINKNQTLL